MSPRTGRTPKLRLVTPTRGAAQAVAQGNRVRLGRVRTAQARIAVDYYDRPLVKERILDAVLLELNKR